MRTRWRACKNRGRYHIGALTPSAYCKSTESYDKRQDVLAMIR